MQKEDYTRVIRKLKEGFPAINWSAGQHEWLWNKIRAKSSVDLADAVHDLVGKRKAAPPPIAVYEGILFLEKNNTNVESTRAYHKEMDKIEGMIPTQEQFEQWGREEKLINPNYNHEAAMSILQPAINAARLRKEQDRG